MVAATLSALLFLIKVPSSPYTRKLASTKNSIAVCYFIAFCIFSWTYYRIDFEWSETFPAVMTFIVTAIASSILSYSLMGLLKESSAWTDRSWLNIMVDGIWALGLVNYYDHPSKWVRVLAFASSLVVFVIQCIIHIIVFNKTYIEALRNLEIYYEEDEEHKIKWIRFCYAMMMLTQMFVLIYLCLPRGWMKIYVLFYGLFMLYFAVNFISFLGSHKLLLDAFAYKTLSGSARQKKVKKVEKVSRKKSSNNDEIIYTDNDLRKLDESLAKWVEDGRYREYDKNRDEIAEELKTSKELIQVYFNEKGTDFRKWRTQLRIEDAKQMLLSSPQLSINIIAERCGFSDRSNFHRQFQKIVGCSPKQWRECGGKFTATDESSRTEPLN